MKDFRILLKNVRPYAGLFAVAFLLMTLVGVFEAGRTALLKSIIDLLSGTPPAATDTLASRIDVTRYLPPGINPLPLIAGLLVLFTIIRGASEYLSNVCLADWVGAVFKIAAASFTCFSSRANSSRTPTNTLTTPIITTPRRSR